MYFTATCKLWVLAAMSAVHGAAGQINIRYAVRSDMFGLFNFRANIVNLKLFFAHLST